MRVQNQRQSRFERTRMNGRIKHEFLVTVCIEKIKWNVTEREREREIQATEKTKPCPAHTQPLTNQHTIDGRTVHRSPQTQPTLFTFNINAIFSIRSQNISNIFFWTVHFVSLFLFSVSQTIGWQEAILSLLMCALLLLSPVPVVVLLFLYSYIFVLVFSLGPTASRWRFNSELSEEMKMRFYIYVLRRDKRSSICTICEALSQYFILSLPEKIFNKIQQQQQRPAIKKISSLNSRRRKRRWFQDIYLTINFVPVQSRIELKQDENKIKNTIEAQRKKQQRREQQMCAHHIQPLPMS